MILLEKEPDAKLGISIRGGGKGSKGNPLDKNDEGIFISKVRRDTWCLTHGNLVPSKFEYMTYQGQNVNFSMLDCSWWSSFQGRPTQGGSPYLGGEWDLRAWLLPP